MASSTQQGQPHYCTNGSSIQRLVLQHQHRTLVLQKYTLARHCDRWALQPSPSAATIPLPDANSEDEVLCVDHLHASLSDSPAASILTRGERDLTLLLAGTVQGSDSFIPAFKVCSEQHGIVSSTPVGPCSVHDGPLVAVSLPGQGLLLCWQLQPGGASLTAGQPVLQPQWTSHLVPSAQLPAADDIKLLGGRISSSACKVWAAACTPAGGDTAIFTAVVPSGQGAVQVAVQQHVTGPVSCGLLVPVSTSTSPSTAAARRPTSSSAIAVPYRELADDASHDAPWTLVLGSAGGKVDIIQGISISSSTHSSTIGSMHLSSSLSAGPVRQLALLPHMSLAGASHSDVIAAVHGRSYSTCLTLLASSTLQPLSTVPGITSIIHNPHLGYLPAGRSAGSSSRSSSLASSYNLALLAVPADRQAPSSVVDLGAVVVEHEGQELLGFFQQVGVRTTWHADPMPLIACALCDRRPGSSTVQSSSGARVSVLHQHDHV